MALRVPGVWGIRTEKRSRVAGRPGSVLDLPHHGWRGRKRCVKIARRVFRNPADTPCVSHLGPRFPCTNSWVRVLHCCQQIARSTPRETPVVFPSNAPDSRCHGFSLWYGQWRIDDPLPAEGQSAAVARAMRSASSTSAYRLCAHPPLLPIPFPGVRPCHKLHALARPKRATRLA